MNETIETWSIGHGDAEAFILRIVFVNCCYEGGSILKGTRVEDNEGAQEGMTKRFLGEVAEKLFLKKDKQSSFLKVGRTVDLG